MTKSQRIKDQRAKAFMFSSRDNSGAATPQTKSSGRAVVVKDADRPMQGYYKLTKPGIIYGNAITLIAGFLLGAGGNIDFGLFLATLIGTCLVIASACVFNNYIDRDIDKKMYRTRKRALVTGAISVRKALLYGTALGVTGFAFLSLWTNSITLLIGAAAFIDYVVLYGLVKRKSVHGTLVGSLAGAAPITAGYTAATGHLDAGAVLLFLILVIWQMPHFYAIAIYRLRDYKEAKLPVLPVVKGIGDTKIQMLTYVVLFVVASCLLTFFHYTGGIYLLMMLISGLYWFKLSLDGLKTKTNDDWARFYFRYSLIILLIFSLLLSLNPWLP